MFSKNTSMGIDDLARTGIDAELVRRMLILESLTFPPSIECIYPKYYVSEGKIDEAIEREW